MPIAEVLSADIDEADVRVADWDRIFSYELRIYDRAGAKLAEKMQQLTGS